MSRVSRTESLWFRPRFVQALQALLFIGLIQAGQSFAQTPQFVGEYLQFLVSDSAVVLQGRYEFRNSGPVPSRTRLFYPVPLSAAAPFPQYFKVRTLPAGIDLPFQVHAGGISFLLEIAARDTLEIGIEYCQSAPEKQFRYILTSTRKWGKPLSWVRYEIRIPSHLVLNTCSLDIDSTLVFPEYLLHGIQRKNFLPLNDFDIEWGSKP